jgi:hypothetical protein
MWDFRNASLSGIGSPNVLIKAAVGVHAARVAENLLARTKLKAPVKVG